MVDWQGQWPTFLVDATFLVAFVLAGLHARRLLGKETPLWDYSGYAAVWAISLAWAMDRLAAPILVWVFLIVAIGASTMPIARGVNRIVRKSDA